MKKAVSKEKVLKKHDTWLIEVILALISALEYRERLTSGHSEKVALYCMMIGKKLKYSPAKLRNLKYASLLHDIGKIGIHCDLLVKKDKLAPMEYAEMKTHSAIGKSILTPISELHDIIPAVYHHHERYDGKGYPSGLAGEAIPLDARIITVADAYEVMTNDRLYRQKVSKEEAIQDMISEKGKQLDPKIVDLFVELLGKVDR